MTIVKPSNMQRVAAELVMPDAPKPALSRRDGLATEAAAFAQVMAFNLLAMRSPQSTPEQRTDAAERVFTIWPALSRRMAELEPLCPSTAASGYEHAAQLRDVAERLGPAKPAAIGRMGT